MSWRDVLPIHPAAELFPRMSDDELRALGEDIKKNGLTAPISIVTTQDDTGWHYELIDGRNRLDAMELAGMPFQLELEEGRCWVLDPDNVIIAATTADPDKPMPDAIVIDSDPYAYVISANIHRRHLTGEQKRDLIAKVLKAKPDASNNVIAKQVKADDKTVASVRREMEARSEIPNVSTRTDARGRKQPAKKSRRETYPKGQVAASTATFEVAGELKDLVTRKAQGWTGAIVATQAEVTAAEGRFRDDGAPGHWLIVAPRERVVVDHRVIQWLLLTAPAPPVVVNID
jgi:hypothetical protein